MYYNEESLAQLKIAIVLSFLHLIPQSDQSEGVYAMKSSSSQVYVVLDFGNIRGEWIPYGQPRRRNPSMPSTITPDRCAI